MAWPRLATANRITAPTAAIALTGIPSGSRTKNPTSRSIKTIQPVLKVARSLIAFAGAFRRAVVSRWDILAEEQMQHNQRGNNGCNIHRHHYRRILGEAQSKEVCRNDVNRLDTISGRLAVSAINPAAMTNASVVPLLNPNASSMAMTIGVRISAAPSLANSAATAAPSRTIYVKSKRPRPLPQRETCNAAHSKSRTHQAAG